MPAYFQYAMRVGQTKKPSGKARKSFTAKDSRTAKEEKSLTAKEIIIRTRADLKVAKEPRQRWHTGSTAGAIGGRTPHFIGRGSFGSWHTCSASNTDFGAVPLRPWGLVLIIDLLASLAVRLFSSSASLAVRLYVTGRARSRDRRACHSRYPRC